MSTLDLAQQSLWDAVQSAGGRDLEEEFWEFHRANPRVYAALRERALELRRMGHLRYSIKTLLEVERWHTDMQTAPTSAADAKYKLNNNHAPFYARLLMEREPELAGFFELRTQTWRRQ
jgi:hypothetical protein